METLKGEYLDVYEGFQSEILRTTRYYENSDLSTIYLGKVNTSEASKIKAEESFPIPEQVYRKTIRWNRMSSIIGYRG